MASPADASPDPFRDASMNASGAQMQQEGRDRSGVASSAETSRPGSRGGQPREKKKKVGFTGGTESNDESRRISLAGPSNTPPSASPADSGANTPSHTRNGSGDALLPSPDFDRSHLPELSLQQTRDIHRAFSQSMNVPKPRPAIRQSVPTQDTEVLQDAESDEAEGDEPRKLRKSRAREAFERGKRLEEDQRSQPSSRDASLERPARTSRLQNLSSGDIPLRDLAPNVEGYDSQDSDSDGGVDMPKVKRGRRSPDGDAHELVRQHTIGHHHASSSGLRSGAMTPTEEQDFAEDYQPRPEHYRGGILGALLKLYSAQNRDERSRSRSKDELARLQRPSGDSNAISNTSTPQHSPPESGTVTPNGTHWFSKKHKSASTSSLAQLIGSSATLGTPVVTELGEQVSQRLQERKAQEKSHRPGLGQRTRSAGVYALNHISRSHLDDEIRITVHIAETIARQKYLMRLCTALMVHGAPTHRLEEYMNMSARVLEIQAQFLYIPGSMIMSFDDTNTHTTEVKLVRVAQGLDLGKLRDVHEVYKDVVHDRIGVEEATQRLKDIMAKPPKHSRWVRILVNGFAAVCVGPFAFGARLIDLPIAFILGAILGILQLVVAPKSDLYANVFEIAATVITSFLARAFGSITYNGARLFCFSALAQSSIALILPGYIVLCASLELQSRSIVAGSIRMVYAIIYSLFLGYGITIGTALYGIIDSNATSATTCEDPMPPYWFFFFVPAFTLCLIIINQAKWQQAPIMLFIAFAGYLVNYFASKRFAGNTQVSNTLGALVIGVLANLYSRVGSRAENACLDLWEDHLRPPWKRFERRFLHIRDKRPPKTAEEQAVLDNESVFVRQTRRVGYSLAAAAMLPAIFVQVPSGLSATGSLVAGIASANQISGNATNGTTIVNATTLASSSQGLNSTAFNVSYSIVQIAIGITVGLFLSAIIVYPFGKRRSGLFSF